MRGECRRSRVPRLPLDDSRLSRSHSEGFGRGTARQKRVAGKGSALMQRFCQAFASAGGSESRRAKGEVEDDDSGVVCSSCYLSTLARMRCAGGRLDRWRVWRAVLMRRPEECGSLILCATELTWMPALSRSLALTHFSMCRRCPSRLSERGGRGEEGGECC